MNHELVQNVFVPLISYCGSLLLAYRLLPLLKTKSIPRKPDFASTDKDEPLLTIVVPARNEAENLKDLLPTLCAPGFAESVIVVDDHSTDSTQEVCKSFNVIVVSPEPLPPGWSGKNWACQAAANSLHSKYVLFTDADTRHFPGSSKRISFFMKENDLDFCSALPFHLCPTSWEKLNLGFHILMTVAAAPFHPNARKFPFAIGQYLVFRREAYEKIGQHGAVRSEFAEDIAFARLSRTRGLKTVTYEGKPLYEVRMYDSFLSFVMGWKRILRWGLARTSVKAFLEVLCVIASFFCFTQIGQNWLRSLPFFLSILVLYRVYKHLGQFSLWSLVFVPVSALIFIALSVAAIFQNFFGIDHVWRGRNYSAN